ncbi:hypothetical protein KUV28_08400 [Ferrimonas balearica]|nr:hypothetical protein [Ferrimonas balearica]
MIRRASLLWSSLAVAGLTLLATAWLSSALGPQATPDLDAYVLEVSAPFVTLLSPPGPMPPSMGGAPLPVAALAAAGWVALCLSLPPLMLRPVLWRGSAVFALPGVAFGLVTGLGFLVVPGAPPPAQSNLPALLSQLFAFNLLLILGAGLIAAAALPLRRR